MVSAPRRGNNLFSIRPPYPVIYCVLVGHTASYATPALECDGTADVKFQGVTVSGDPRNQPGRGRKEPLIILLYCVLRTPYRVDPYDFRADFVLGPSPFPPHTSYEDGITRSVH